MSYTCYYHPNLPASGVCSRCGRRICVSCAKVYGNLTLCPTCFYASVMRNPMPQTATARSSHAQENSKAKPRIPYRRTIIALLTISAVLIWLNADLLLDWPDFYAFWVGIFPWIIALGSLSFILGVILGLVIDMAVVMFAFGLRVEAAFIVIPTAIISFFIGGGFLAGLIIAVLTGIFIMKLESVSQTTETQPAAR